MTLSCRGLEIYGRCKSRHPWTHRTRRGPMCCTRLHRPSMPPGAPQPRTRPPQSCPCSLEALPAKEARLFLLAEVACLGLELCSINRDIEEGGGEGGGGVPMLFAEESLHIMIGCCKYKSLAKAKSWVWCGPKRTPPILTEI